MSNFLKTYQDIWLSKLDQYPEIVCRDIVLDDTGDTDQLTQALATLVLSLLNAVEKEDDK